VEKVDLQQVSSRSLASLVVTDSTKHFILINHPRAPIPKALLSIQVRKFSSNLEQPDYHNLNKNTGLKRVHCHQGMARHEVAD
jgi:hypothetical protein